MIAVHIFSAIFAILAALLIVRASKTHINRPSKTDGRRPQVQDDIHIDLFFALVLCALVVLLQIVSGGAVVLWGMLT